GGREMDYSVIARRNPFRLRKPEPGPEDLERFKASDVTQEWLGKLGGYDLTGGTGLTDLPDRTNGTDRTDTNRRVRGHWQRRLKEAVGMPEGDLKQEAVKAAEDALRDWGGSGASSTGQTGQYGGDRSGVADRVRAHWRRRLREAMDMSDADPQLKQQ